MNRIALVPVENIQAGDWVTNTDDPDIDNEADLNEDYDVELLEWLEVVETHHQADTSRVVVSGPGGKRIVIRAYQPTMVWTRREA